MPSILLDDFSKHSTQQASKAGLTTLPAVTFEHDMEVAKHTDPLRVVPLHFDMTQKLRSIQRPLTASSVACQGQLQGAEGMLHRRKLADLHR